jgi:lipid-binding SYLF domain-containing protein
MTGALFIGGTHGEGLASCRDSNDAWSQPAAISLNQGSIGLQAGAKSADLVLFFQDKGAVQALKRGNFALGTDVSAVAGNYDSSVDTSRAGVVVYTRTEGVFAGASVNGSKIGNDQKDLAGYYGKDVDYTALLEGRESPDSSGYTKKLTKLFL